MLVKINTAALNGLSAMHVFLEVNTYKGTSLVMVGLPDNAVRESLSRVSSALHNSSLQTPRLAGTINFAPADVRKEGTGYDLPLAIGLLAACKMVGTEALPRCVLVGELGLDGSLRPVKGALPIAVKAREMGFDFLVVPRENAREAAVVNRLKVYGAGHIKEVVDLLDGRSALMPTEVDTRAVRAAARA